MSRKKVESQTVQMAKAINNVVLKQGGFAKAVHDWEKWNSETFFELNANLSAKNTELKSVEEELSRKRKRGEIEADNHLVQYKRNGAIRVLGETEEIPVASADWKTCQEKLSSIENTHCVSMQKLEKEHSAKTKKAVECAVRNCELKHKAETATVTAAVEQQQREIKVLQDTIDNLKHEISEQRKLTKDVATAGRAAAITQHVGGKA